MTATVAKLAVLFICMLQFTSIARGKADIWSDEKNGWVKRGIYNENSELLPEGYQNNYSSSEEMSDVEGKEATRRKGCDCGKNSVDCRYFGDEIKCDCKSGFSQKDNTCEACECGENSKKCLFISNEAKCECKPGFSQKGSKCEVCDCGENSKRCNYIDDVIRCECKPRYSQKGNTCEVCECGKNSRLCQYVGDFIKCYCNRGFIQKGNTCKEITAEETTSSSLASSTSTLEASPKETAPASSTSFTTTTGITLEKTSSPPSTIFISTPGITLEKTNSPPATTSISTPGITFGKISSAPTTTFISTPGITFKKASSRPPTTIISTPGEDICDSNPCQNGARCISDGTSYVCECHEDFVGSNCSESRWCAGGGEGFCGEVDCAFDVDTRTGYCDCNDSTKFFDSSSKACKPIDQCALILLDNKCNKPHETCVDGNCLCETNYRHDKHTKTCVADFCQKTTCPKNAVCKELGFGNTICVCKPGYYNKGKSCKKINLCSPGLSSCEQVCDKGKCSCQIGFELNDDNRTCKLIDSRMACSKDCGIGTCILRKGSERCICPSFTHVNRNDTCVDRCSADGKAPEDMCPDNLCISDKHHGLVCKCEGLNKKAPNGIHCQRKSMCAEGDGDRSCSEKLARCQEDRSAQGGFKCVCDRGYGMDPDGVCLRACDVKENRDECVETLSICELDNNYQPVCKCPPLLTKDRDGKCKELAKNSFTGDMKFMKRRYKVQTDNRESSQLIDYVLLNRDIEESLKFVYENYEDSKILNCKEENEFLTCSMELQLDQVPEYQLQLIVAPSICVPLAGTTSCWIKPHVIIEKKNSEVIFKETDPCEKDIRIKLCGSTTNCESSKTDKNFQCRCKSGFQKIGIHRPVPDSRTFIERCNDLNECSLNPSICPNTTFCVNTAGSYKCICKEGYRKSGDSLNIEEDGCIGLCEPSPCIHGRCVLVGNHGFMCDCQGSGYSGYLCNSTYGEINSWVNDDNDNLPVIVGSVLGSLLIVLLIIVYVMFRKIGTLKQEEESRHRTLEVLSEMTSMDRRLEENGRSSDRRPVRPLPERSREERQNRRRIDDVIPGPEGGRDFRWGTPNWKTPPLSQRRLELNADKHVRDNDRRYTHTLPEIRCREESQQRRRIDDASQSFDGERDLRQMTPDWETPPLSRARKYGQRIVRNHQVSKELYLNRRYPED